MTDDRELEARLRASLGERSRHAPDAYSLTERILAAADSAPHARERRARHWRAWTLPLVAAASVAAVVLAVIGLSQFGSGGHGTPAADGSSSALPTRSAVNSPTPSAAPSTPTSAPHSSTTSANTNADTSGLRGFQVADMTFVAGGAHGWALGTATCMDGTPGRCAALVRTTDGGRTWHSMTPPPDVAGAKACTTTCVSHIRFANDEIGYAYGPGVVFMTRDSGANWKRLAVPGSLALEISGGTLVSVSTKCRPGCPYVFWTAPVGSPGWKNVGNTDGGMSPGVSLVRNGNQVVLAVFGHTTGGAQDAPTMLWSSADAGFSWTGRHDPCPRAYGEVDVSALAMSSDGAVTVLCTPRQAGAGHQFVMTSHDHAATFRPAALTGLGRSPVRALAAGTAKLLLVALADGTYRSTDGGAHFTRLSGANAPGAASWIGFETPRDVRAVSANGRTIWTSHDGGGTWSAYTFR